MWTEEIGWENMARTSRRNFRRELFAAGCESIVVLIGFHTPRIANIMLATLLLLLDSRRGSVYRGRELFRCNIAAAAAGRITVKGTQLNLGNKRREGQPRAAIMQILV